MEIYRVAFIGHRNIDNFGEIEKKIEILVSDIIEKHEFTEFLMGRNGDFDISAASAVKRVQKRSESDLCELTLVLPYTVKDIELMSFLFDNIILPLERGVHYRAAIRKRNEWLMENSDLVIAYVQEGRDGGAMAALRYAEKLERKVINLAKTDVFDNYNLHFSFFKQ